MWLLERAACTVVSERARDGVAPCFLAEIWAQMQNESKVENKDPVAPWGCVFERNTADSEKQIDL